MNRTLKDLTKSYWMLLDMFKDWRVIKYNGSNKFYWIHRNKFFLDSPIDEDQGKMLSMSFESHFKVISKYFNLAYSLEFLRGIQLLFGFWHLVWFLRYLEKLKALSQSPVWKLNPIFRVLWTNQQANFIHIFRIDRTSQGKQYISWL